MSLVKPAGIEGLNTGHPLNANITQFLEFGNSNTDLVTTTAFTTGATNADIAELGKCVLATSTNVGVSVNLNVSDGDTVLTIYKHNGDGSAGAGSAGEVQFYELNPGVEGFTLKYRYFTDIDYTAVIRGNGGDVRSVRLAPFQGQGFLHGDPHALALSASPGSATDLMFAYMDGTELAATDDAPTSSANSGVLSVPIFTSVGTSGDTYLSAIIVFNKRLSASEMQSVTTDPWALVSVGPAVTVTQAELTPGGTISGTYIDYTTVPTTLTVSDGTNTIGSDTGEITGLVINDNGDGSGDWTATMPDLPASGTADLIQFTDEAIVELA